MRSPDASAGPYPRPSTRNGKPQSRLKTAPDDWVTKCDQKPSCVPGRRRLRPSSRIESPHAMRGGGASPVGRSRAAATTATNATTATDAEPRNAGVHPAVCSTSESGIAESTCPSWPTLANHCDRTGTRGPENQELMRRRPETNVMASPAPTSTRPRIATSSEVESASVTCPATISSAPVASSARGPIRSISTPTGTCSAAYTTSCVTASVESSDAETWNRSTASTDAMPSEPRCSTDERYATMATPRTRRARRVLIGTTIPTAPGSGGRSMGPRADQLAGVRPRRRRRGDGVPGTSPARRRSRRRSAGRRPRP